MFKGISDFTQTCKRWIGLGEKSKTVNLYGRKPSRCYGVQDFLLALCGIILYVLLALFVVSIVLGIYGSIAWLLMVAVNYVCSQLGIPIAINFWVAVCLLFIVALLKPSITINKKE